MRSGLSATFDIEMLPASSRESPKRAGPRPFPKQPRRLRRPATKGFFEANFAPASPFPYWELLARSFELLRQTTPRSLDTRPERRSRRANPPPAPAEWNATDRGLAAASTMSRDR